MGIHLDLAHVPINYLKEKLTSQPSVKASLFPPFAPSPLATSVFERTKDDEKIASSIENKQLQYILTSQNPADVATRPVPACSLTETNWLTGLSILQHPAPTSVKEAPYSLLI